MPGVENIVVNANYVLDAETCAIRGRAGEWELPPESCRSLKPLRQREFPAAKLALRVGRRHVKECYVLLRQSKPGEGAVKLRLLDQVPEEVCETDEDLMSQRPLFAVYDEETGDYLSPSEITAKLRVEGGLAWTASPPV